MTVRRLRAAEWARWRDIRLAALRESPEAFGSVFEEESALPDARWQERAAAAAAGDERALFIAEQGGDWVGCAGGFRDSAGATPALISMWVAPRARRHGLARLLVEAVRDWAAETGAGALTLHVVSTQQPARAAYEGFGFAYTGRSEPGRRDSSQVLLEMELKISRTS